MSKKPLGMILSFVATLVLLCSLAPAAAFADGDPLPPTMTSVSVNPTTVEQGGTLNVDVGFTESGVGISIATIKLASDSTDRTVTESFDFGEGHARGELFTVESPYKFVVPIPNNLANGDWYVSEVFLQDASGKSGDYLPNDTHSLFVKDATETGISVPHFTMSGTEGDITKPVLNSIAVTNNTIEKPGTLGLDLDITEDGTGVSAIDVSLSKDTNTGIAHWFSVGDPENNDGDHSYYPSSYKTGSAHIDFPIPKSAKPGDWIVSSIKLTDEGGNESEYSVTFNDNGSHPDTYGETALVVPSFTITGEEVKAPDFTAVQVANDGSTVNRPGILKLNVTVPDSSSEIIKAFVMLESDDGVSQVVKEFNYYEDDSGNLDTPIPAGGTTTLSMPIKADNVTGTWHVKQISLWNDADMYNLQGEATADNGWKFARSEIVSPAFTVADDIQGDFTIGLNNPDLLTFVDAVEDGETLRVRIQGTSVLPKKAFDFIKGYDRTLVVFGEAYQWVINGQDIVNETKDVDVSFTMEQVPNNALFNGKTTVTCTFADNGLLPGKVTFRMKSDYLYEQLGLNGALYLYYVNNGEYEEEAANFTNVIDGTDHWCSMDLTHNSTFVVSPEKYASESDSGNNGNSGDDNNGNANNNGGTTDTSNGDKSGTNDNGNAGSTSSASDTSTAQQANKAYPKPTMSNSKGGNFASSTDEITYTVLQQIPDWATSVRTWVDLDDVLEYTVDAAGVTVATSDGSAVPANDVTLNGQRLTVTINDATAIRGKTLIITYKAKLRSNANLDAYLNDAKDTASVPYQAHTAFDGEDKAVDSDTEYVKFKVGNASTTPQTGTSTKSTIAKTGDPLTLSAMFIVLLVAVVSGATALTLSRRS